MAHTYKNSKVDLTSTIVNGSDTFQFLKDAAVSAKATIQGMGGHNSTLVLTKDDILKATAATANRLHVITSYLEVT